MTSSSCQGVIAPAVSGREQPGLLHDGPGMPAGRRWPAHKFTASRHVEHRVAGADANPYLVAAVVLSSMRRGIEARVDPGSPVQGNGYAQSSAGDLPLQWHAALDRAAQWEFLADALGPGFLAVFLAIKRRECEKFGALVSDRDYEWYLYTT